MNHIFSPLSIAMGFGGSIHQHTVENILPYLACVSPLNSLLVYNNLPKNNFATTCVIALFMHGSLICIGDRVGNTWKPSFQKQQ
jgi:hypothetical protein